MSIQIKIKSPINFAKLLKPWAKQGSDSKPQYMVTHMIHKSDEAMVARVKKAINDAWEEAGFEGKLKKSKNPLVDGAEIEAYEDRPQYHDYYMLKLVSYSEDKNGNKLDGPEIIDGNGDEICDVNELSNGKILLSAASFKAYDHPTGGKGVGAYINAGMVKGDVDEAVAAITGESAGEGKPKATSIFADELDGDDAPTEKKLPPKKGLPPKKSEPKYEMTEAANGWTREELHEQGYTDAELIESELMKEV